MKTLANLLKEFDGRHLAESQLTEQFEMIAKAAIYGGHFRVNDEDDIYIVEVEFYFHSEQELFEHIHEDTQFQQYSLLKKFLMLLIILNEMPH